MPCLAVIEAENINATLPAEGVLGLALVNGAPYFLDFIKDAGTIARRAISIALHNDSQ